jgi:hypothetical protein
VSNFSLHQVGPLLCVRTKRDFYFRKPNGDLFYPPEVYVPRYDERNDFQAYEHVSWDAAKVLSQSAMIEIERWLRNERNAE